ncbi:RHS repeat domain-containing protein [Sorangium sp. So ce1099]|uniref:RHS repeat domain-containing protein n=1 Tax=Sorangium sp. So ce1099 TaxID=3133331 RepID=UPI003F5D6E9A
MWLCTAIEDRNRNRISLAYESGRLAEVVDSAGRTLRFHANREGRVAAIEVKNALTGGRWVTCESYEYDAAGHLVSATDADGFSARYEYDEEHRLTGDSDRVGLCFHFRYDAQGRCIESWGDYPGHIGPSLDQNVPDLLASGRHRAMGVHHCVFDYVDDDFTHVIDSTHVGHFEHNEHGLLTNAHDSGPSPMRAAYTSEGFLKALEHPDGGIDRYEWDGRGNVLSHTDPLGATTSISRDAMGLAVEIVDPLGGVTRITRDARGNPEAVAGRARSRRRGPRTTCTIVRSSGTAMRRRSSSCMTSPGSSSSVLSRKKMSVHPGRGAMRAFRIAPLQSLRIPTGWSVVFNNLCEIDPSQIEARDDARWEYLEEDLLALRHEPLGATVNVGWYPSMDPDGSFKAELLIGDDWQSPLSTLETRSLSELIAWIEARLHDTRAIEVEVARRRKLESKGHSGQ